MLVKAFIFSSTFFAASFAGWNFSNQDQEQSQEEKQEKIQKPDLADPKTPPVKILLDPAHITSQHSRWVKSGSKCSDCHSGAGEKNSATELAKEYHRLDSTEEGKNTPYLGVVSRDVPAELRSHLNLGSDGTGVMIEKVLDESPAFFCGLEKHDILLSINDTDVIGTNGLAQLVRSQKPKTKVSIKYIHGGKKESISLVLGTQKLPNDSHGYKIHGCIAQINANTICSSCHKTK